MLQYILSVFEDITKNFFFSYSGFRVGLETFIIGIIFDNTISIESKKKLEDKNPELLIEGYRKVTINLLLLSPYLYYFLENYLITKKEINFNFGKYCLILLIHSFGYYYAHIVMHKINIFKEMHKFHHKFTNILIPSIGNAVSVYEFTFAYASPFILASYLLDSNLITLNYAIKTVSFFNLMIHCNELKNLKYYKMLVSPNDHLNHHKLKREKNTYSAPIINMDYIANKIANKLFKSSSEDNLNDSEE